MPAVDLVRRVSSAYRFDAIPRVDDAVRISTSYALDGQGVLRCWADNAVGQLGLPPALLPSSSSGYEITF